VACFEHSNFFTVKDPEPRDSRDPEGPRAKQNNPEGREGSSWYTLQKTGADPAIQPQTSATSFSTATTLAYATGAGITAAAGTRLAHQLLLVKVFTLYSFL